MSHPRQDSSPSETVLGGYTRAGVRHNRAHSYAVCSIKKFSANQLEHLMHVVQGSMLNSNLLCGIARLNFMKVFSAGGAKVIAHTEC